MCVWNIALALWMSTNQLSLNSNLLEIDEFRRRRRSLVFFFRWLVAGIRDSILRLSLISFIQSCATTQKRPPIPKSKTLFKQVFSICSYHDFGICISLSIPRSILIRLQHWNDLLFCWLTAVVVVVVVVFVAALFFHCYYLNSLVK